MHNPDKDAPYCGQPRPEVCFRGMGLRISQQERDGWNKGVDVRFQNVIFLTFKKAKGVLQPRFS